MGAPVVVETRGPVAVITIDRPQARNALNGPAAAALADAVRAFEADGTLAAAVLTGAGGTFCAGADLKALASGRGANRLRPEGDSPMGPTRRAPAKPVVAAIEGHAVAGGLELALWCDLRVAASDAVLGVFSRRFGVPLVDGGTVRLPRLVGLGRALDLVLTGRPVEANEALAMGLVDRVVPPGEALAEALRLCREIASFPQTCLLADRASLLEGWGLPEGEALRREFERGLDALTEARAGAARFAAGEGRHGAPLRPPDGEAR